MLSSPSRTPKNGQIRIVAKGHSRQDAAHPRVFTVRPCAIRWHRPTASWGPPMWARISFSGLVLFATVLNALCLWATYRWLRRARRHRPRANVEISAQVAPAGVTILKPLCGLDEGLEDNLASFFALDYAPLQLIFCSDQPDDPGLLLARRVARRFPTVETRILHHRGGAVPNPKVRSLAAMLGKARHPLIMLSDSNVRVAPGDLRVLVDQMADPSIGLVYQPVVGVGETTLPAAVENLRWNDAGAVFTVGLKRLFHQHAPTGKGMLVRREALNSIGDFSQVGFAGADDFVLAEAISQANWRLEVAQVPARAVHALWGWRKFFSRHVRHASFRRKLAPWFYPLELFLNPVAVALPALALGRFGLWLLAAAAVCRTLLDLLGTRIVRGTGLPARYWLVPFVRDFTMLPVWLAGLVVRRISWRDQTYELGPRTRLTAVERPTVSIPFHSPGPAVVKSRGQKTA